MDNKERLAQLVAQLQSGDQSAFSEIYKLTSPKAFYVAFEITKNEQDAEDILQESYITALDKIATLDKPESFVGWFHRIVANKSKDSLKKKKPSLFTCDENEAFEVIADEDTDFIPEESVDKSELQQIVMSVLDELSEDKRTCVLMYYFEECSVNDIAQALDVPVSTVKNRLFTARKDLQGKFSKRGITSAYSVAPIGVVLWAMRRASETVAKGFIQGPASPKILAALSASGSGAAATAGATGAAAATGTAVTASTAAGTGVATGAGLASKVAAMTLVQKVVAGVATVAIVSGSGVGVAAIIRNRNKAEEAGAKTTATITEEVTTAFYTQPVTENAMLEITEPPSVSLTDTTATSASAAASKATTKPAATTKAATTKTTTKPTTAKSTTKPTTTKPTTTKPTTTKPTTTQPTTAKPTTTKPVTTQKPTTTKPTTTKPTTTKPTTTKPTTQKPTTTTTKPTTTVPETEAPAKLIITVNDGSGTPVTTITRNVPAGMAITEDYVYSLVTEAGYDPWIGVFADGFSFGEAAQSGKTYKASADT